MNRRELRGRARIKLDDTVGRYLFGDDQINIALNDAVQEANLRARFLVDSTTPAVVEITVVPGTPRYTLHPSIIVVRRAEFAPADGTRPTGALRRRSFDELDRHTPCWRDATSTRPCAVVQDLEQRTITLVSTPTVAGTLRLVVWRHPLDDERMDTDADEPCIPEQYHRSLTEWVVWELSENKDAETRDTDAMGIAYDKFEAEFGKRPTAQQLRALAVDREGESDSYFW